MTDSLQHLAQQLDSFAQDRDWQPFHSPKNLASALVVEAGELLEPLNSLFVPQCVPARLAGRPASRTSRSLD